MNTAAAASSPAPLATKPRGATTNFTLLGADAAPHFDCVALRDAAVADGAAPRAALVLARGRGGEREGAKDMPRWAKPLTDDADADTPGRRYR